MNFNPSSVIFSTSGQKGEWNKTSPPCIIKGIIIEKQKEKWWWIFNSSSVIFSTSRQKGKWNKTSLLCIIKGEGIIERNRRKKQNKVKTVSWKLDVKVPGDWLELMMVTSCGWLSGQQN